MTIEDKITERLKSRINDNIIYLADFEVWVTKIRTLKSGKVKEIRKVKIQDMLYENNPGEHNKKYALNVLSIKCNVSDKEKLEIKKVILKKELSCSFYKR